MSICPDFVSLATFDSLWYISAWYMCEVTHHLHEWLAQLCYCCPCLCKGCLASCWNSREARLHLHIIFWRLYHHFPCSWCSMQMPEVAVDPDQDKAIQDLASWSLFAAQQCMGKAPGIECRVKTQGKLDFCFSVWGSTCLPCLTSSLFTCGFFEIANEVLLAFLLTAYCKISAKLYLSNMTWFGSRFNRTSIDLLQYHILFLSRDSGSSYPMGVKILRIYKNK